MSDSLQFFGPYRVIRTLARGGMAEIFLAKKEGPAGFSKSVVVKRILPQHSQNEEFVQMFRDEARLAAQLEHPNIVHITDFGEVQGSYYLAMEYLQGADLGSLLRMRSKTGAPGPFPAAIAAHLCSLACAGLHYAHTTADESGRPLRIVHRDISPNNLFLTFQGALKVLDFGIAKAEGKLVQTRAGIVKGKLLYMSPEQTWGKLLDARSDVWALGVVLYELLTGQRPFFRAGETAELNERMTMEAIDRDTPPPPSSLVKGIPSALDEIVLRCVEKAPASRWQSALELQRALEAFVSTQGGVTASALARLMEETVGVEHVRAATQQTPAARSAADPEAGIATQLKPADDQAVDREADVATQLKPANQPAQPAAPPPQAGDEATRLKPLRSDAPARRSRAPLFAVAIAVLGLGGAALYSRAVGPPGDEVLDAGAAPVKLAALTTERDASVELEPSVDAGALAVDAGTELAVVEQAEPKPAAGPPTPRVKVKVPQVRKELGKLKVHCAPFGVVAIDDREIGRASPELTVELPAGTHRVRCIHPTFGESATSVTLTANETVEKRLKY